MARYEPNWAEKMMEPVEFGGYYTAAEYDRCKAAFAKAQSEVVRHVARIHALTDALRIARGYVDDDRKPLHEADLALVDAVLARA